MSKNYDTEKYKKTFIAAGVTCLPVAAMFITYAVFLIFYFTGLFPLNMNGDTAFAIVALIFILLKPFLMFVYIFFAIISGLIATGYICSGIALIKRSHNKKIENSLALSFVISVFDLSVYYQHIENYRARYYARIPFRLFRSGVHTPFPIGNQHSIQPKSLEKTTALNLY